MPALLLLVLLLLPATANAKETDQPAEITQVIALREGAVQVRVRGEGVAPPGWVAYQAALAAAYLPAVERYLDRSFHRTARGFFGDAPRRARTLLIVGQARVLLKGRWIGAYNNTAGLYPGERAIFLEYDLSSPGNPASLSHELGHYWLYNRAAVTTGPVIEDASWFNEGAVCLLPLVLVQAGLLSLTPAETAALAYHYGLARVPFQQDFPVQEDRRPRGGDELLLFYQKSFQTHAILRRELGPPRYRLLLQEGSRHISDIHSSDDVLRLLDRIRVGSWRGFLGGWVFATPYGPYPPLRFRDAQIGPDGAILLK